MITTKLKIEKVMPHTLQIENMQFIIKQKLGGGGVS